MLTVQNGVDSVDEVAAVAGEGRVIGGTTYIATALSGPGRHRADRHAPAHRVRRSVRRSCRGCRERVRRIHEALAGADIQSEAVGDGRVPIWEKFIFLVSLAGFTGASRLPIGPVWADPFIRAQFLEACREVERLARAEGVPVAHRRHRAHRSVRRGDSRDDALVAADRSVAGEADRSGGAAGRGRAPRGAAGVPVPIMSTLYAVLKPWAAPTRSISRLESRVVAQPFDIRIHRDEHRAASPHIDHALEVIDGFVSLAQLRVDHGISKVAESRSIGRGVEHLEPLPPVGFGTAGAIGLDQLVRIGLDAEHTGSLHTRAASSKRPRSSYAFIRMMDAS